MCHYVSIHHAIMRDSRANWSKPQADLVNIVSPPLIANWRRQAARVSRADGPPRRNVCRTSSIVGRSLNTLQAPCDACKVTASTDGNKPVCRSRIGSNQWFWSQETANGFAQISTSSKATVRYYKSRTYARQSGIGFDYTCNFQLLTLHVLCMHVFEDLWVWNPTLLPQVQIEKQRI